MDDMYLLLAATIAIGLAIIVFAPFILLLLGLIKWLGMYDSNKTRIRDNAVSAVYLVVSSVLITFTIIKSVTYIQ